MFTHAALPPPSATFRYHRHNLPQALLSALKAEKSRKFLGDPREKSLSARCYSDVILSLPDFILNFVVLYLLSCKIAWYVHVVIRHALARVSAEVGQFFIRTVCSNRQLVLQPRVRRNGICTYAYSPTPTAPLLIHRHKQLGISTCNACIESHFQYQIHTENYEDNRVRPRAMPRACTRAQIALMSYADGQPLPRPLPRLLLRPRPPCAATTTTGTSLGRLSIHCL